MEIPESEVDALPVQKKKRRAGLFRSCSTLTESVGLRQKWRLFWFNVNLKNIRRQIFGNVYYHISRCHMVISLSDMDINFWVERPLILLLSPRKLCVFTIGINKISR